MSVVNLILFTALIFVGVRAMRAGIRGLRGEIGVRYGWPFTLLWSNVQ